MAKSKKAPAAKAATPRKSRGGTYAFLLVGLIMAGPLVFAAPALLVFTIGMVPAMVAFIIDREPGRNAALAVTVTNAAGVTPFIIDLVLNRPTLNRAMVMLSDVFVIAVIYGTAGIGWLLVLSMPKVAAVYLSVTNETKVQMMRREQRRLVEEWGEEVKEPAAS
ncbi:MAG: hypothetical protein CL566_02040 [Alphaproteobacteria bacterium]|nr:hypothetical protein [Alphaproteobacteria bacterium]|tara:strand:- start:295 stop:786 length:492 start_codon:yes stop_codon:yes gene_type:complete